MKSTYTELALNGNKIIVQGRITFFFLYICVLKWYGFPKKKIGGGPNLFILIFFCGQKKIRGGHYFIFIYFYGLKKSRGRDTNYLFILFGGGQKKINLGGG